MRHYIDDRTLGSLGAATIWNEIVPIKVNILTRRIGLNRVYFVIWTTQHLFIDCDIAKVVYAVTLFQSFSIVDILKKFVLTSTNKGFQAIIYYDLKSITTLNPPTIYPTD